MKDVLSWVLNVLFIVIVVCSVQVLFVYYNYGFETVNDIWKTISSLDTLVVVLIIIFIRHYLTVAATRINNINDDIYKLQSDRKNYLTKEEFNEVIDLKMENIETKLSNIQKSIDKL